MVVGRSPSTRYPRTEEPGHRDDRKQEREREGGGEQVLSSIFGSKRVARARTGDSLPLFSLSPACSHRVLIVDARRAVWSGMERRGAARGGVERRATACSGVEQRREIASNSRGVSSSNRRDRGKGRDRNSATLTCHLIAAVRLRALSILRATPLPDPLRIIPRCRRAFASSVILADCERK